MGTSANSEDPDKSWHFIRFCTVCCHVYNMLVQLFRFTGRCNRQNISSEEEIQYYLESIT